jgi:hypothetical protein
LVLSDELGEVHVSEGTGHNHLFVSARNFSPLGVSSSTEYGENVSETEVVMALLGKLLFAKFVKNVELLG